MNKCTGCNEKLPGDGDYVPCKGCNGQMHYECSGLRESTYRGMSAQKKGDWRCVTCRGKPRTISTSSNESPELQKMLSEINDKLNLLAVVNDGVESLKIAFYDMKNELHEYKEKVESLETRIKDKDRQIEKLETRLLDLEQYSRKKNVEVIGLKKQPNEDMGTIFQRICNKINVSEITMNDVDKMHRLPNTKGNTEGILIRFKSMQKRDIFLQNRKAIITNKDIWGANGNNEERIYVTENQSKAFKQLFWEMKQTAIQEGYKYIWSRDGKIFIKRTDEERKMRIRSKEDILGHNQ
jgi:archaellum component FlaC